MWRRSTIVQLLLLLTIVLATIAFARMSASNEVQSQDDIATRNMHCKVYCDQSKLGVAVAEITWPASEDNLKRQVLEVTVHKNGFEKAAYATLAPIRSQQKFVLQRVPREQEKRVPGLGQLVVSHVFMSKERGEVAVVRVEGLEPGLNYFWRLRSTDGSRVLAVTRCQGPVCPADMQDKAEQ